MVVGDSLNVSFLRIAAAGWGVRFWVEARTPNHATLVGLRDLVVILKLISS